MNHRDSLRIVPKNSEWFMNHRESPQKISESFANHQELPQNNVRVVCKPPRITENHLKNFRVICKSLRIA